uniref:Uncharacterized protein n=1 Tax=Magallana gigas TaxID=29159 RepID=K1PKT2_MAGGI
MATSMLAIVSQEEDDRGGWAVLSSTGLGSARDGGDSGGETLTISVEFISFLQILTNKTTQARHSWTIYLVLKTEKEHRLLWGVRIHPNPLHIIIHYNSNHLCCFAVHCPLQPGLVVVPNDQHREGGVPAVAQNRFTTVLPLPAEENVNVKNSPCVVSSPFYVTRIETCQA